MRVVLLSTILCLFVFSVLLYNAGGSRNKPAENAKGEDDQMSKKETDVGYSPDQIAEMKAALAENDFTRTISVGHTLELDPEETELMYIGLRDAFAQELTETDRIIYYLREQGCSGRTIAKRLGYKSRSTVSKRLKAMKERFDRFVKTVEADIQEA